MDLPLSDHMRGLDPSQSRLGRMEGLEAKHRIFFSTKGYPTLQYHKISLGRVG
jgi:hypothetical protein